MDQPGWLDADHVVCTWQHVHRLQILTVVKVMLAIQSMHATNHIRDKLYNIGPLTKIILQCHCM